MTRFRRLTAALAAAALLLSGCGLPDRTDPKYVGPAANPSPAQGRIPDPPKPANASGLSDLVVRYLMTSVGGNITNVDQPDALSETQTRMKTFMTEEAAASWSPTQQTPLTVVRVTLRDPKGDSSITADFERVGVLNRDGQLVSQPSDASTSIPDFVFTGRYVGDQLLLSAVPEGMLLSMGGLDEWYVPQPVYFWEKGVDAPKLVPDLRYMPKILPPAKRVGEVMQWLAAGPSLWLNGVVDELPSDIETKDSPTLKDDKSVVVNLSSKALAKSPEDLRKLATQIRWSLEGHPSVTLSYENSKDTTNVSDGYRGDNAAAVGELDQEKFVIADESVRQADITVAGPPALFGQHDWNSAVVSATVNRARTRAALVRRSGTKQQLVVNTGPGDATYVDSGVPLSATLSRPAWINRPVQRFLVADGTRLWAVTPPASAGEAAQHVIVPGLNDQQITNVSAFSVSPDGRRIALIVSNKVVVASLRIDNGKLTLGEQHVVPNSLGGGRAVGWITETTLAIGGLPHPDEDLGPDATYSLIWTSIDGTGEKALPLLEQTATSTFTVDELSARTNDPTESLQQVLVLFEANQSAQVVFADGVSPIQLRNLGPTPSPPAALPQKAPLSPFYAD